jgi:hypothetical protein
MMKHTKATTIFFILFILILTASSAARAGDEECTAAVITPGASLRGVPILWKNRDTDVLSNKVVYVEETPFSYLALVNADCRSGRHAFAGLNSAGFGIMNTVAYNLPQKSGEMKDLEGIIMADALRTCRSVEDFEKYIQANLGPFLGSWANYGVIDPSGNAYLFEIHNHGYQKIDAASAPEKYLVVTNYARSGEPGKGAGYLRFERASQLFHSFPKNQVNFQTILSQFTRDVGHILLKHPSFSELKNIPRNEDRWILTRDCINRSHTSAAVVITGKEPSEPDSLATMWVIPGEPISAIAIPLWVESKTSPELLWKGDDAALWQESFRIKGIIRPNKGDNREEYLNLALLDNAGGTGYLPQILRTEEEIINSTLEFLKKKPQPAELAVFEQKMAEKACAVLKSIH